MIKPKLIFKWKKAFKFFFFESPILTFFFKEEQIFFRAVKNKI